MTPDIEALITRLLYEFNSHPADTDRKEAAAALREQAGELAIQDKANDILTEQVAALQARVGELEQRLDNARGQIQDAYGSLDQIAPRTRS